MAQPATAHARPAPTGPPPVLGKGVGEGGPGPREDLPGCPFALGPLLGSSSFAGPVPSFPFQPGSSFSSPFLFFVVSSLLSQSHLLMKNLHVIPLEVSNSVYRNIP